MRVLLGAFGDPGHAFPVLALGAELVARGHDVGIETWQRWREPAEAAGMTFSAAPEYQVFPTRERPLKPYEAAVRGGARRRASSCASFAPDVAVSDILTPAPALAAELEGVPVATRRPARASPTCRPGFPPFSIGARLPRTRRRARACGGRPTGRSQIGLEQGRREYNDCRARLGLAPLPWTHTGLSRSLTMVATFPQLEYPRAWPSWTRVVGPLMWEPGGPLVDAAAGRRAGRAGRDLDVAGPLALAAARVPGRAGGRAGARDRDRSERRAAPANAVLVPWMSYARDDAALRPRDHPRRPRDARAGAGVSGCPVLVCPAGGDMAENAARVDWAGVGVRLAPRFCTPWGVRLAVRRALARPGAARAGGGARRVGPREPRARRRRGPAGALGRGARRV